jgi:photosystem II stability/assembly factor-like uncharacterized protein
MTYLTVPMASLLFVLTVTLGLESNHPRLNAPVKQIVFPSADTAYLITRDKRFVRTTDGGATWTFVSAGGTLLKLCFIDSLHGWSVDFDGNIRKTSDGGLNWPLLSNVAPGEESGWMGAIITIQFTDETNGWIVTPFTLWRTRDGGLTHKVHFSDENKSWLYTDTALYRTIDGGSLWNAVLEYARPSYKID